MNITFIKLLLRDQIYEKKKIEQPSYCGTPRIREY